MKQFLLFFIISIFVSSCQREYTEAELIPIDTLETDIIFDNYYHDKKTNKEYLIHTNYSTTTNIAQQINSIDFYDFSLKKQFSFELNTQYHVISYFVHTLDSIFAIAYHQNRLLMFDKGRQVNDWDINIFSEDTVYFEASGIPMPNKGCIYFKIGASLYPYEYYKEKFIGAVRLNEGKIVSSTKMINFPQEYQQKDMYFAYWPSFTINNDELIISYDMSHDLYIYKNDSNYRQINAKSQYLDTFEFEYIGNDYRKQEDTIGKYIKILYDPYRNLYYRLAKHEQNLNNSDGTANGFFDSPWSIIVLDKNFKIIDEIAFKAREYRLATYIDSPIIVTKAGLILTKRINKGLFEPEEKMQILYKINLK